MSELEKIAIRNLQNDFLYQAQKYREYRQAKQFPDEHCQGAILAYEEAARKVADTLTAIREHR